MNITQQTYKLTLRRHIKYVVSLASLWTGFIVIALIFLVQEEKKEIVDLAIIEAESSIARGIEQLRWTSEHGELFMKKEKPATAGEPDESYIAVNHKVIFAEKASIQKLNTLQGYLINGKEPSNDPRFDRLDNTTSFVFPDGTERYFDVFTDSGEEFVLYLMKTNMDESCMECHSGGNSSPQKLSYAVSTTVPLKKYAQEHKEQNRERIFIFFLLWFLGMCGITLGGLRIYRSLKKQIHSEEELKQSWERFQFLYDVSPLPYLSLSEDGLLADINDTWLLDFGGYTKKDVLGRPLADFISEKDHSRLERFLLQIQDNEIISGLEMEMIKKDGSSFLASLDCRKMFDPQKKVARILCIINDITEKKKNESRLLESEKKYRLLIDNTLEGIIFIKNERIHLCSRRVRDLTGFTEEELTGKPFIELIYPDDTEILLEAHKKRIAGENFSPYLTFRIKTRSGEIKWVESRTMSIQLDGQNGTLSFVNDITDRKKLEEQLFISEKMTTIASLAAGVAHEINTPLSAILQSIQVINNSLTEDNITNLKAAEECGVDLAGIRQFFTKMEIDYFIDGIRDSAMNASKIINSLLEFSRPRQGEMVPSDMNRLIESSLELARADYDLRKRYDILHVEIFKELAKDLPPVTCVPMEIEQVLLNLLKNSVHALADDTKSESPRIMIRTYQENDRVAIEVEDNGMGMPKEIQKKIFDPFFTTKDIGIGTGLGLSVSYTIIHDKHQGSISVESNEGKGTKFTIELPIQPI